MAVDPNPTVQSRAIVGAPAGALFRLCSGVGAHQSEKTGGRSVWRTTLRRPYHLWHLSKKQEVVPVGNRDWQAFGWTRVSIVVKSVAGDS